MKCDLNYPIYANRTKWILFWIWLPAMPSLRIHIFRIHQFELISLTLTFFESGKKTHWIHHNFYWNQNANLLRHISIYVSIYLSLFSSTLFAFCAIFNSLKFIIISFASLQALEMNQMQNMYDSHSIKIF